ncbi:MAG: DNA repair protein RadA [Acidobacteriota bacterium]
MARTTTVHVCQSCGYRSAKWLGRCPDCGEWSTLVEETVERTGAGGKGVGGRRRAAPTAVARLDRAGDEERVLRFASGLDLVDRVLGGGVVTSGATLLAGEPGIGKSTLILQIGHALARSGTATLYVSAEESPRQLRLRAERLGCADGGLLVAGETHLEAVLAALDEQTPRVVLVDSIQALRSADLDGPPGSIGQVRHCADRLVEIAKARQISLFLVGHVTKEGAIAGPKSLEHLVDTVLTFEGEGSHEHRVLRAQKNRFGPTGEVALFEMRDTGLTEVPDPSRVLLSLRREHRPGSAVLASLHGSRPLLVEVQALVHPTSFPSPRRMAVGLDGSRVTLLVAVLGRFGGLSLAERDLFLNVVGGLNVKEPAADLAILAAVFSAERELPLPEATVFFGEVGLLGEVRPVARSEARLKEAAQLGFRRAVVPKLDRVQAPDGLEIVEIEDLDDLPTRMVQLGR